MYQQRLEEWEDYLHNDEVGLVMQVVAKVELQKECLED
jgi:hypothetical protein